MHHFHENPFRGRGRYPNQNYRGHSSSRGNFDFDQMQAHITTAMPFRRPAGASFHTQGMYLGVRISEFEKFRKSNKFPRFTDEELEDERTRCEQIDTCLAMHGRMDGQELLNCVREHFKDVASFNDVNELVEFVSLRSNLFDVEEIEEKGGQKTVLFIANRPYPDRFGWTRLAHYVLYFSNEKTDDFDESYKNTYNSIATLLFSLCHSPEALVTDPWDHMDRSKLNEEIMTDLCAISPPFRDYMGKDQNTTRERIRRLPHKQGKLFEIFEDHVEVTEEALSIPSLWRQSAHPRISSRPAIDRSLSIVRTIFIPKDSVNISTIAIVNNPAAILLPERKGLSRQAIVMIDSRTVIMNGRMQGAMPEEDKTYICLMAPATSASFDYLALELMDLDSDYAASVDPSKKDPAFWNLAVNEVDPSSAKMQEFYSQIEKLTNFAMILVNSPIECFPHSLMTFAKSIEMELPFVDILDIRRFLVKFLKNAEEMIKSDGNDKAKMQNTLLISFVNFRISIPKSRS
ncbi:hypothetical protein WR25_21100 [Diploscapter pachys]|uniref:Uncharacterized protein n=1 Tax=Diploscapter pachys TaxID=2018661 RepID=A0A2A2KFF6_9BILA|nr:hypothetical protein WR25_21100 [Diploscapter pachys]